jgi:GTPase SAR1 family protein
VIVYDITDRATFEQIGTYWLTQLRQHAMPNIVIALAGNKADMESKREVSIEEAAAYCESEGLLHRETSARTGDGVDDLFGAIAGTIRPALAKGDGEGTGFSVYEVASATRQSSLHDDTPTAGGCAC